MVKHPFLTVKQQFKFCKTVYCGTRKNLNRLYTLFGSANILMCARAGRTENFRKSISGELCPREDMRGPKIIENRYL